MLNLWKMWELWELWELWDCRSCRVKRGCDLLTLAFKSKIKRSQPRFTRQLLHSSYTAPTWLLHSSYTVCRLGFGVSAGYRSTLCLAAYKHSISIANVAAASEVISALS